jgi:hypothetical protein
MKLVRRNLWMVTVNRNRGKVLHGFNEETPGILLAEICQGKVTILMFEEFFCPGFAVMFL